MFPFDLGVMLRREGLSGTLGTWAFFLFLHWEGLGLSFLYPNKHRLSLPCVQLSFVIHLSASWETLRSWLAHPMLLPALLLASLHKEFIWWHFASQLLRMAFACVLLFFLRDSESPNDHLALICPCAISVELSVLVCREVSCGGTLRVEHLAALTHWELLARLKGYAGPHLLVTLQWRRFRLREAKRPGF